MNITRHVIFDLLPVYAAGEAHADTARLVEHWIAGDPELAREAETLRGVDSVLRSRGPRVAAAHELLALRRTRIALRLRSTLLGLAIFFSLLPLSFSFDGTTVHWLVLANPAVAMIVLALAVAGWLGWFLFAARMRVRSGV